MAHRRLQAQQHVFQYQSFHINKSQPLGHGSYGAVYKAKCDQLPCAAKVLHPTILDPRDLGAGKIMERFQQECAFLESIRHPNIVQYLGMTRDPESRLPVLLMELLDENLTKMLERSQQSLAYCVQMDICHDIALAVTYLHSNDIIHRDLSSNNVLIIAGRRAKVTDFGMSKLAGAAPSMTSLTMCPGTLAYMPPEALREPPRYTNKLDCFSEGVIMIQVCTRLWPEPGPRNKPVPDSRSPTGMTDMPVLETERRKNHIDMINPTHKLLPIIMDCLKYQEKNRPSSEELCQRLASLKESVQYRESVQQQESVIQAKDDRIASLTEQLLDNVNQLKKQTAAKTQLTQQLSLQQDQLRKLNVQLKEQAQISSELQQIYHFLQRQVEQLQQQLSQQSLKPLSPQVQARGKQHHDKKRSPFKHSIRGNIKLHPQKVQKMTLTWRGEGRVPSSLGMVRGAAVVKGSVVYFMNREGQIFSYYMISKSWILSKIPPPPYGDSSSLAVISDELTAIGGRDTKNFKPFDTNKLLTLHESHKTCTWVETFPPMPTRRSRTTTITSNDYLLVAGGDTYVRVTYNTTVEVMNIKHQVWSTVASLPHPYRYASGTICGDQLYILGGLDDNGKTKSVLTCSLTELLQSSSLSSSIWHRVADAPAYYSTCEAVNGELLSVGGLDERNKPTSTIHQYNPTTDSWDLISNMPTARYQCLIAVLPFNEMMVVGGNSNPFAVEIATI